MPRAPVPETIRAIAFSACIVEPELLNSERIKQRFSSYGLDVLDSENGLRRASLHSVENGSKVCRTCAVVRFDSVPADIIGDEHKQILEGASIGETFKSNGWTIYKETRYVGELQVPAESSALLELMALGADSSLAIHAYRLLLNNDRQWIKLVSNQVTLLVVKPIPHDRGFFAARRRRILAPAHEIFCQHSLVMSLVV